MKIIQKVTVKQVLTENSKQKLLGDYEKRKFQLGKECDQLRFELKKLEKTKKYASNNLKGHFEKEIESRQEKIKLVDFQIDQLHILPLGSELKDQEIQSVIDVQIGDNWDDISAGKTLIIEDGVIKDIR
ncbi:YlqD family protein [Falsibacillus albus]|uniref:YlqD protein n=1 Tax=Falsibacillus albus TaxID=2478915 RepID=A0A3L7JYB1_9BACI|nr:YlqD family protein [Falsibacillus albus]RLQ95766.1 hypothetical protein D9X91_09080 [Falsibacillus albus]